MARKGLRLSVEDAFGAGAVRKNAPASCPMRAGAVRSLRMAPNPPSPGGPVI